jgi:hypothetical protein
VRPGASQTWLSRPDARHAGDGTCSGRPIRLAAGVLMILDPSSPRTGTDILEGSLIFGYWNVEQLQTPRRVPSAASLYTSLPARVNPATGRKVPLQGPLWGGFGIWAERVSGGEVRGITGEETPVRGGDDAPIPRGHPLPTSCGEGVGASRRALNRPAVGLRPCVLWTLTAGAAVVPVAAPITGPAVSVRRTHGGAKRGPQPGISMPGRRRHDRPKMRLMRSS